MYRTKGIDYSGAADRCQGDTRRKPFKINAYGLPRADANPQQCRLESVAAIWFENRGGLLTVYLADWTALRGNPAGSSK